MQSSRECVFFRFGLARDFPVGEPGAVVGGPRPARGGRSSPSVVGSGASEGWPLRQVPTPTASRPPPRVRRVCPPSGVPPRRVPRELLRSVAAVGRSPGTPPASVRGPPSSSPHSHRRPCSLFFFASFFFFSPSLLSSRSPCPFPPWPSSPLRRLASAAPRPPPPP